jgi:prevent-host-death family protein
MKKSANTKKPTVYATGGGAIVSVREAKAQLSALVGRAAKGEEITITWHGQSRARLAPILDDSGILRVNRAWLKSQPLSRQDARAEDLIRADRDARG